MEFVKGGIVEWIVAVMGSLIPSRREVLPNRMRCLKQVIQQTLRDTGRRWYTQ